MKQLLHFRLAISLLFFLPQLLFSQTIGQNYSVTLSVTTIENPPQILLQWKPVSGAIEYNIYRKGPTSINWGAPIATLTAQDSAYNDNTIMARAAYEYKIEADRGGATPETAFGYAYAGIRAPAIENRGGIILVVDNTFSNSLALEIATLEMDLVGDGWTVYRMDVDRNDSPTNVRSQMQQIYTSNDNIFAALLLGHVPVPYSGNLAPDGHPDHEGAWPADVYYADMDGNWTDNTVNTTSASRAANRNVPGDGKFDQTVLPSPLELAVGRIDLSDLPAFSQSEEALMRTHLNKLHSFKTGFIFTFKEAIIDDNFQGMDEGFSQNGWRNFGPLVGRNNIEAADFFTTLQTSPKMWSYACGPGSYTSAGGVGNTSDFASKNARTIFTALFGSYFGDWDNQNNFLRAALASGNVLVNTWAGRPNWFFHHMGLGEPIATSAWLSLNNPFLGFLYEDPGLAAGGIHSALLGDPSLRMDYFIGPQSFTANAISQSAVELNWTTAITDNVLGYFVYRATEKMGPYQRLTADPVTGFSYTDGCVPDGTHYYMVRPVKLQYGASGTYINLGLGVFDTAVVSGGGTNPVLEIEVRTTRVSCPGEEDGSAEVVILAGSDPYSFTWSTGDTSRVVNDLAPGNYVVTVTDGCGGILAPVVTIEEPDSISVNLTTTNETSAGARDGTASAAPSGGTPPYSYRWNNGGTGSSIGNLGPGNYRLTVTDDNGCFVIEAFTIGSVNCNLSMQIDANPALCFNGTGSVSITVTGGTEPYTFVSNGPGNYPEGTYVVTVRDAANCFLSDTFSISQPPQISLTTVDKTDPDCPGADSGSATVSATGGTPPYQFIWSDGTVGPTLADASAGTYSVSVTDANNCTRFRNIQFRDNDQIPPVARANDLTIYLDSNGEARITGTQLDAGSTDNCELDFVTAEQVLFTCDDVGQNTIIVSAFDLAGNEDTTTATVTVLDTIQLQLDCPADILVNACDSVITYSLPVVTDNCGYNGPSLVSGIGSGNVFPVGINVETYEATDADGNRFSCSFTVRVENDLNLNIIGSGPSCFGSADASLIALPEGGTGNYSYNWSNGSADSVLTGITAGMYSLTLTDENGCEFIETADLTPLEPSEIIITVDTIVDEIGGSANGEVQVSVEGGTPPYDFTWTDSQGNIVGNGEDLIGVMAGEYSLLVTDENGCETLLLDVLVDLLNRVVDIRKQERVHIFPNPATNTTMVEVRGGTSGNWQVELIDQHGRLLQNHTLNGHLTNRLEINLETYPAGIYRTRITLDKQVVIGSLIKL